jgi:thiol-disulfide isomerase/thioredoxin
MKMRSISLFFMIVPFLIISACTSQPAEIEQEQVELEPLKEQAEILPTQPIAQEQTTIPESEFPEWFSKDLTDVNSGDVFRIEDFKGKVVLVETMAFWCAKCNFQQKEVAKLYELLGERDDFVSLGIEIDPNEEVLKLSDYVQRNGFHWLYVVASEDLINEIGSLYGPQFLNPPATPMLIIDKQGKEHILPFGIKSAKELQTTLQPFFDEDT